MSRSPLSCTAPASRSCRRGLSGLLAGSGVVNEDVPEAIVFAGDDLPAAARGEGSDAIQDAHRQEVASFRRAMELW